MCFSRVELAQLPRSELYKLYIFLITSPGVVKSPCKGVKKGHVSDARQSMLIRGPNQSILIRRVLSSCAWRSIARAQTR